VQDVQRLFVAEHGRVLLQRMVVHPSEEPGCASGVCRGWLPVMGGLKAALFPHGESQEGPASGEDGVPVSVSPPVGPV
jgi:hypothetical protein